MNTSHMQSSSRKVEFHDCTHSKVSILPLKWRAEANLTGGESTRGPAYSMLLQNSALVTKIHC